jgi:hypothetical protein
MALNPHFCNLLLQLIPLSFSFYMLFTGHVFYGKNFHIFEIVVLTLGLWMLKELRGKFGGIRRAKQGLREGRAEGQSRGLQEQIRRITGKCLGVRKFRIGNWIK